MADHARAFPSQSGIAAPAACPKSPLRWAVPLVLFMVIIGGIAWLVQYLPPWRTKTATPQTALESKSVVALLGFVHPFNPETQHFVAPWEPLPDKEAGKPKKPYAREFERNEEGRYYFPFMVKSDQDVELGISYKSCDCAKLSVAIVTQEELKQYDQAMRKEPGIPPPNEAALDWKSLEKTEENGVVLPDKSYAILRMVWTNRRGIGESLNLVTHLWARTPATSRRQTYAFRVDAVSSQPLRAKNDRIDVGMIDPDGFARAEFLVWSPTRDELKFSLQDRVGDALFKLETAKLSAADCADLQAKLRSEDINTRVRAAWRVSVTVHETLGKHQLELGHFIRAVKIDLPEAPEDLPSLYVFGRVRSEIRIGGAEDQGKINLKSFPAKFGAKQSVLLSTDNPKIELEKVSTPAGLTVQLQPEKSARGKAWRLHVEVPAGAIVGRVPEDFVVSLRIKGTSRLVRIPIVGNGVQG